MYGDQVALRTDGDFNLVSGPRAVFSLEEVLHVGYKNERTIKGATKIWVICARLRAPNPQFLLLCCEATLYSCPLYSRYINYRVPDSPKCLELHAHSFMLGPGSWK